jgi:hypothetical protein
VGLCSWGQCEKGCRSGTCGGGPGGCGFRFWFAISFAIFVCDFGLRFLSMIPFVGREKESAKTAGERERERERERESWVDKGERRVFFIRIFKGTATVFPNALENTVETQWRRLNIGLLLWGCFCGFFLFFP